MYNLSDGYTNLHIYMLFTYIIEDFPMWLVHEKQQQKRNIWPVWQLTNTIVLAYVRTIQYFLILDFISNV
jgi:hypothetical protein